MADKKYYVMKGQKIRDSKKGQNPRIIDEGELVPDDINIPDDWVDVIVTDKNWKNGKPSDNKAEQEAKEEAEFQEELLEEQRKKNGGLTDAELEADKNAGK